MCVRIFQPIRASMEPKAVEGKIHSLFFPSSAWAGATFPIFCSQTRVESRVSLALRPSDSGIPLLLFITVITHNDHGILWKEGLTWGLRSPGDKSPYRKAWQSVGMVTWEDSKSSLTSWPTSMSQRELIGNGMGLKTQSCPGNTAPPARPHILIIAP